MIAYVPLSFFKTRYHSLSSGWYYLLSLLFCVHSEEELEGLRGHEATKPSMRCESDPVRPEEMNGEETWREGEGFWRGGGDDPRSVSTAYNRPYMAVTPIGRRPRQQNITGTLNDNMVTETEYAPVSNSYY